MNFYLFFLNPQGKVSLVRVGKCWCSSHTDREEFALEESAVMSTEQNSALKPSALPEILDLQQFFKKHKRGKKAGEKERRHFDLACWSGGEQLFASCV